MKNKDHRHKRELTNKTHYKSKKMENNNITRRNFLKILGLSSTAVATSGIVGCNDIQKDETGGKSLSSGKTNRGPMTMRENPANGDKVSILGYGCMRFPTLKEADAEGNNIDQETTNQLIDYAMEHGVNYYDTSPVYLRGFSERATGIALKRHDRSKFFIATKLSNFSDYSFENSVKMYNRSFKELQVDYIDYYLLHSIGGNIQNFEDRYINNGIMDFLLKEREAGKIRNLGFSYHGNAEGYEHLLSLHEKYHWDFVQIQLNYVDWIHESKNNNAEYLYNELEKRGIPAVIMEPLLGGRLANVNNAVVTRMKTRRPESSIASWAFRFAGTPKGILTVLSGMTYMEHLKDNIYTYSSLEPCSEEEIEFLKEMARYLKQFPTIDCTQCQYCMPCPYGIDIPSVFAHYNKCVNEGNVSTDKMDENYAKARRAYLVSYDRQIPRERQADHCISCRKCVDLCPQKINIPRKMKDIDKFVEQLKQMK